MLGIFLPRKFLSEQQNRATFKLRVHTYSWRDLSRGQFSIELGQVWQNPSCSWWSSERVNVIILRFQLIKWLNPQEDLNSAKQLKNVFLVNIYHCDSLYNWFIISVIVTSLAWWQELVCSYKIINYWDLSKKKHCGQASITKMAFLTSWNPCLVFFLQGSLPYLLLGWKFRTIRSLFVSVCTFMYVYVCLSVWYFSTYDIAKVNF